MATLSGSTNYQQTAGDVVRDALIHLGVATPSSTISDATNTMCLRALNDLIKDWQQDGAHLWTQHEAAIVFNNAVASYTFPASDLSGGTSGVVRSEVLVQAELDADATASAVSLTLDSTTGMAANDIIFIELDDGTRHDTTIVSVDSATTITITSGLASAASSTNFVWAFPPTANQTNVFYPRQITDVRLKDARGTERVLSQMSREEYYGRPDNTLAGTPMSYYIDDQLTNKKIILYPVPDNLQERLSLTYVKALDDTDALTDNIEFPPEWTKAMKLMLACDLAHRFGKEAKLNTLMPLAQEAYARALAFDDDHVSVQVTPDLGYY